VETILAPASLASQGQISGMGLAQAKTMASSAMEATTRGHGAGTRPRESNEHIGSPEGLFGAAGNPLPVGLEADGPFFRVALLQLPSSPVQGSPAVQHDHLRGINPGGDEQPEVQMLAAPRRTSPR